MTITVTPTTLTALVDARTRRFNLLSMFDDPRTTGLVATFQLYDTSLGGGITNVLLFDQAGAGAPGTVQNFQTYVNDGDYVNSFIHRSAVDGMNNPFVIQGGGFTVENNLTFGVVPTDLPIANEFDPNRSNVRGTIAMAKTTNPDSATSQWFFNLQDNSSSLDDPSNSGGFTVFGEVLSEAEMAPVDAIAALPRPNLSQQLGPIFNEVPIIFDDPNIPVINRDDNFVRYESITIAQQNELSIDLIRNTNRLVVDAEVVNNRLVLDFVRGRVGDVRLVLEATNLQGDTVRETLLLRVRATNGADVLRGTNRGDRIVAFGGNDRVSGFAGADQLFGSAGNDVLLGGGDNDVLNGGAGRNVLLGGTGNDRLVGGITVDRLRGGAGNDVLLGGSGNDRLQGDLGRDRIVTGGGRDLVLLGQRDGVDTVVDFRDGFDRIQLLGALQFNQLTIRPVGNNTLLRVGQTNLAVLQNVDADRITRADFI
jgi:peptidyl-prolyl cis-trans isomerase A (cyclophilin A)